MRQASNSATYVAGSESFSEMTSEPGSIQSGVPRMPPMHHPPSFNRERSNVSGGGGRESVFSETSTELSISSGSGKELSPSKYYMCNSITSLYCEWLVSSFQQ